MIKSKKYYIIVAVIAGVGLFLTLIGGLLGGLKIHSDVYNDMQRSFDANNPQSLLVNVDVGTLTIKKNSSGSGKIEVSGTEVSESCIRMTETPTGDCNFQYDQYKAYGFSAMQFGKYQFTPEGIYEYEDPDLTISVPESVKRLVVRTNIGDLQVYDISADNVQIFTDIGSTYVKNIDARNIEVETDVGDVQIDGITADTFEIESDVGRVDIENANVKKLDATAEVGDFSFTGIVTTFGKIDSDVGEVRVVLTDDIMKYNFDVKSDLGILKINGQQYGTPYRQMASGTIPFTIESEVGDIDIN